VVTREGSPTQAMVDLGQACGASGRQIRQTHSLRRDVEPIEAKWVILYCQEKPLASEVGARTPNRRRWASREY
jgi:hypothetical protein